MMCFLVVKQIIHRRFVSGIHLGFKGSIKALEWQMFGISVAHTFMALDGWHGMEEHYTDDNGMLCHSLATLEGE